MKKISEMSFDELRDHALSQEQQIAAATQRENDLNAELTELKTVNQALQNRNNKLFMQLEQQTVEEEDTITDEPQPVESCEDFAAKFAKGEI